MGSHDKETMQGKVSYPEDRASKRWLMQPPPFYVQPPGSGEKPADVIHPAESDHGSEFVSGPIYIPPDASQDDMVLYQIPVGNLGTSGSDHSVSDPPMSDPSGSLSSESILLAPLTVAMPDDLGEDMSVDRPLDYEGDVLPSSVYISEGSGSGSADGSVAGDLVSLDFPLPRLDPATGRYTASSFKDFPDEWID